MRLSGVRVAESVVKPAARRNVTLGVVKHLWRSPVPFVGFYPPEGVKVTENRRYAPASSHGTQLMLCSRIRYWLASSAVAKGRSPAAAGARV